MFHCSYFIRWMGNDEGSLHSLLREGSSSVGFTGVSAMYILCRHMVSA
jgi:hypothetical protein